MEIIFHPVIIFELLLGGVIGRYLRWPIFRVLSCLFVPVVVALVAAAYYYFAGRGDERGWAVIAFINLVPTGFVAYSVGVLVGYLLRRFQAYDT